MAAPPKLRGSETAFGEVRAEALERVPAVRVTTIRQRFRLPRRGLA